MSDVPTEAIVVSRRGATVELLINRPERKNALNLAMYQSLTAHLADAEQDSDLRVVVLTGAGDCFTSGNDLRDFAAGANLSSEDSPIVGFMRALMAFPKPVVVAVDGLAVGIGTTLLLHCDWVCASPRSVFKLPFASLGLCPEFGASWLLPRLLGPLKASDWLLSGREIPAEEALQAQLVNALDEDPLAKARAWAEQLAQLPPGAVRDTKALIRRSTRAPVEQALTEEFRLFARALRGAEFAEAVTAFLEKRPADFSGFR